MEPQHNSIIGVSPQSLLDRFGTKKDLYKYMVVHRKERYSQQHLVGLFLPNLNGITSEFIKQILRNEKSVLKQSDVRIRQIPKYQELSMRVLLPKCLLDEQMAKYLPDIECESDLKHLDKDFFFGIYGTIKGQELDSLFKASLVLRYGAPGVQGAQNTILMSQHWAQELTRHPFQSSTKSTVNMQLFVGKKGKGVFRLQDSELLKQKKRGLPSVQFQQFPAEASPFATQIAPAGASTFSLAQKEDFKEGELGLSNTLPQQFDSKMKFNI